MRSVTPALVLALVFASSTFVSLAGASHETPYATCTVVTKDVVLVIDRSSSMLDQGKMAAAKNAANALLGTLSPTLDQSALVSFATGFTLDKGLDFNHAQTQAMVTNLVANGATNLGGAIRMARFELANGPPDEAPGAPYSGNARPTAKPIMIVLSDGDQTVYSANPSSEAYLAKQAGVTVFSVALGTSISPGGLAVMQSLATSPSHFYASPSASQLIGIFQTISQQLNDQQAPTVGIVTPDATNHRSYSSNVNIGPSQYPGVSTAVGVFSPVATASDDCLVDRVVFALQTSAGTIALGSDHTAPYSATFDCDALPAGRHTLVATVYDWLNKTSNRTRDIVCVRAFVDAQATSFYARVTNPADPMVRTEGAKAPASLPGADTHDVMTKSGATPLPHDLSALHDEANGSRPLPGGRHLYAQSLSRQANATLATLGLRIEALETSARAQADADPAGNPMGAPTPFAVTASGAARALTTGNANLDNLILTTTMACVTNVVTSEVRVEECGRRVTLDEGVTLVLDETITLTGPAWKEVTVNGVHLLVDRPEMRGEVILSQSYAGASWIGAGPLRGPWRALDVANDAGSGADARPGPLMPDALPLAPGTYGARLADANDADAYAFAAQPGQKLHVTIAASDQTRTTIGSFAPLPAPTPADAQAYALSLPGRAPTTTGLPSMTVRLLDPAGGMRDLKMVAAGAAAAVELNVDMAGDWIVLVSPNGLVGDYTMQATRVDAPFTDDDDALLGVDAGGSCASALLVGPGAHLGTLEHGDAADWYRFQLEEGQILALALRPGDTLEAADMRLRFHGPDCAPIALGIAPLAGLVKGSPELVTFNVPTGAGGLYRAEVSYVNGIGTYELAVAPSVVATP